MQYYVKLDNTNHITNIYLQSQITDATGYQLVNVTNDWLDLFVRDWTSFYLDSNNNLNLDINKQSQTQQLINSLEATNAQQAALNRQVLAALAKLNAQSASK